MNERGYRDQTLDNRPAQQERLRSRRLSANPDDPPVRRPPITKRGVRPGPYYLGLAGRTAIVQGQVFLVTVLLIVQLWLITVALYGLLSGSPGMLGWLTLLSAICFLLALIITFWPRRLVKGQ